MFLFFFIFFFFKQKTAYEMRISDWSSDVCSSDLAGQQLVQVVDHRGDQPRAQQDKRDAYAEQFRNERQRHFVDLGCRLENTDDQSYKQCDKQKIGRASCRERVCKYV